MSNRREQLKGNPHWGHRKFGAQNYWARRSQHRAPSAQRAREYAEHGIIDLRLRHLAAFIVVKHLLSP